MSSDHALTDHMDAVMQDMSERLARSIQWSFLMSIPRKKINKRLTKAQWRARKSSQKWECPPPPERIFDAD